MSTLSYKFVRKGERVKAFSGTMDVLAPCTHVRKWRHDAVCTTHQFVALGDDFVDGMTAKLQAEARRKAHIAGTESQCNMAAFCTWDGGLHTLYDL